MDELRGLADEIRTAIKDARRPSFAFWQYVVIIVGLAAVGGGCAAYIERSKAQFQAEILELRIEVAKLKEERYTVARILSMMKEDPKNFKRNDAQIEAVKEYERTRATSGRPSSGGR